MSDVVKEQGLTPDRLAGAMRHLSIYAPKQLDEALEQVAKKAVLPAAIRMTPRGTAPKKEGEPRLASSLKVRTRIRRGFGNTQIYSNLPYANTIHWGRKTLTRKGKTFESVVEGKKFIKRAVDENAVVIGAALLREIDEVVNKVVPRGN